MNRMNLLPDHSCDWQLIRRLEQRGRYAQLAATRQRLERARAYLRAAQLPARALATRLAYVNAVAAKLDAQHREAHACYPFSIN